MQVIPLQHEQTGLGATHKIVLTHADLTTAAADTDQVIPLLNVRLGTRVECIGTYVPTPFEDASDAALNTTLLSVGETDPDEFLTAQELNENGTEVLAKAGTGDALVFLADDTVDATVESMTGKSLVNIDVGEVWIFLRVVHLPDL